MVPCVDGADRMLVSMTEAEWDAVIAVLNVGTAPVTAQLYAYTAGDPDSPTSAPAAASLLSRAKDRGLLDEVLAADVRFYAFWFWLGVAVSGIALLLSLAGVYSVTSYTVARRTREIGIRRALGASPRDVVLSMLIRPLAQVGLGLRRRRDIAQRSADQERLSLDQA